MSDGPLFEIRDRAIDSEAIMAELRRRIAERRVALGDETEPLPAFALAPLSPEVAKWLGPTLYQELRHLNDSFNDVETSANLADSPATQLPLVGRAWRTVRRHAHDLVLFYVNRQLAHQVTVNRTLIGLLNQMAATLAEQRQQIDSLQRQLDRHDAAQ